MSSGKVVTTIGYERRYNPALQIDDEDAFVAFMNADQPVRPANLENIVAINQGRLDAGATGDTPALTPEQVRALAADGGAVIDIRSQVAFGAAHVPGSLNLQVVSSEFEQRVGWVAAGFPAFALVADDADQVARARAKLAFVGLAGRVAGWLSGGMLGWTRAGHTTQSTPQCTVHELRARREQVADTRVLDVRDEGEFATGHIPHAIGLSFKHLDAGIADTPLGRDDRIYVVCKSGQRSSTACSLLLRAGYTDPVNVTGGMDAWKAASFPLAT